MNPLPTTEPDSHRPINERFLAYLDQLYAPRDHRRWATTAGLLLGAVLVVAVVAFALVREVHAVWPLLPLGVVLASRSVVALTRMRDALRHFQRVRGVVQNGIPVTAYLVQANEALFRPGTETLPCLVLFSFQPEVDGDGDYMRHLASRVYSMKNTTPVDPDRRFIASLTTDERAVLYRRRKLPLSFTDGSTVYCADLWVRRAYVKGGYLKRTTLPCLAEPGESGGIELIPAWLLSESEERAVSASGR